MTVGVWDNRSTRRGPLLMVPPQGKIYPAEGRIVPSTSSLSEDGGSPLRLVIFPISVQSLLMAFRDGSMIIGRPSNIILYMYSTPSRCT